MLWGYREVEGRDIEDLEKVQGISRARENVQGYRGLGKRSRGIEDSEKRSRETEGHYKP